MTTRSSLTESKPRCLRYVSTPPKMLLANFRKVWGGWEFEATKFLLPDFQFVFFYIIGDWSLAIVEETLSTYSFSLESMIAAVMTPITLWSFKTRTLRIPL